MQHIRSQFPIFSNAKAEGKRFIYLDNAATTQKPLQVIKAMSDFYSSGYANIGRGLYWPATTASKSYESIRQQVKSFINASSSAEVIFTSGTTDGINKIVNSWLLPWLEEKDEVLVSEMEHHANFVPWQQACLQKGAEFKVIPLEQNGTLDVEAFFRLINNKVKLVAITAVSNTLGVVNELDQIITLAHKQGAKVLVDAAQLPLHSIVDVQRMDCDFLVFSAHKIFGPTGIGVVYGKEKYLTESMPFQYGGGMVEEVNAQRTLFAQLPMKHEGGSPNVAGVIGLGTAIEFIQSVGVENIASHSDSLRKYAVEQLSEIGGLHMFLPHEMNTSILSFTMDGIHPHDIASFLADKGIAVRAGHHCTHPLIQKLKISGTVRLSFTIYNTRKEIDELKQALLDVKAFFG